MNLEEKVFKILKEQDIKIVSFDVYDTVLFRMVRHPERIYDKTFEKNPALFPDYIDEREWREIRSKTEQFVRDAKGKEEITLDEVYMSLPKIIGNREKIKAQELNCEKEYSYINTEIAELIQKIVNVYGKKVVLTSDMYLLEEQIREILQYNGFPMEYIDAVYVSSNRKFTKRSGELYDYVISEYAVLPEQMLHIGDNRTVDVVRAREHGWNALYYPLRSEAFARFPYTSYEVEQYGYICDEIHTLRILAASKFNGENAEERFWYELGAMIIGPLLTYATEWVLDVAEKENIKKIFPMMREGKFYTELLKKAKQERNWEGSIEPMYISRKALYPALLGVLKKKDVEYNLSTHKMTVERLFKILGIENRMNEFEEYRKFVLADTKNIFIGTECVFDKIQKKVCSKDLIESIKQDNINSDEYLFGYLQQLGMDKEDYITYDVGWRGNAQNAIQRIMNKHNVRTRGLHLLTNGKKFMMAEHNLEDGCEIRGYTGNFGKNERYINEVIIPIFEMFLMCDEGSTVGYKKDGDSYQPLVKEAIYNKEQLNMMYFVQKGVKEFQNQYYALLKKKGSLLRQKPEELLMLAGRLMNYPTKKEAELIGKMQYDQNFGIDEAWQIISETKLAQYQKMGYAEFVRSKTAREDEWYGGMNACLNGLDNYKTILFPKRYIRQYEYCMFVERLCKTEGDFVLVGAGTHLMDVVAFLNIMNEEKRVVAVMDGNRNLHGEKVCGYEICSFDQEVKCQHYVITIASKKGIEELSHTLRQIKGSNIKISHIYE